MSAPGCCRHCADMCAARLGAVNAVHLGRHSQWGEEACPACDEAERIADWLEQREKENGYIDTDGDLSYRVVTGDAYAKEIREMNRGGRR